MGQDKKRLLVVMLLSLVVLYGWDMFMKWQWPEWYAQRGKPPAQQVVDQGPATQPGATAPTNGATTGAVATTGATQPGVVAAAPARPAWHARGDDAGNGGLTSLGSGAHDDKAFVMAVDVLRRGAAIDAVTLNQFKKTADDPARYVFQEPYKVGGQTRDDSRSLLTRSVSVDGQVIDLSGAVWRLESSDAASARFSVDLYNGETAVAKVVKTFKLTPRSDDPNTPQGYEVNVGHRVENLTDRAITVKAVFNGPTAPPRELESQPDQHFVMGYWTDGAIKVVSHLIDSEFSKDHNFKEFTRDDKNRATVWSGAQSAYFNALVRPIPFAQNEPTAGWLWKVYGEVINPAEEKHELRRVALRYETGDVVVPARDARQFDMDVYFGPKGRKVLNTEYYSSLPRRYDETLVISGGWCGICTFQWLINVLVWMLTAFHFVTRDWGLAIICLVLVVRALLHPVTKRSQIHMVKMQKMGPEMEKLKKKFANDKEALAKAQMQFYKEQGMTPILGCLPMFLQMPIWIALWNSLQSTFELRHSPFLWGFTWIHDLAKPDYLVKFSHSIPLIFGMSLSGINILPILMGFVFYLQMKLQPKPATMTPEQAQQQKMMTWMSTLMFPLFLYSGPSGLNLYILTSTAFGILESKVIRDHIKQREALEAEGPTIIDAPPPGKVQKVEVTPKKKGWMERLQDLAENAKRDADKRTKGR